MYVVGAKASIIVLFGLFRPISSLQSCDCAANPCNSAGAPRLAACRKLSRFFLAFSRAFSNRFPVRFRSLLGGPHKELISAHLAQISSFSQSVNGRDPGFSGPTSQSIIKSRPVLSEWSTPASVAPVLGGVPSGPQLFSMGSPSRWTLFPSIFTVTEPSVMNLAGPCVFADSNPPPVPLLAMSPMLSKVAPQIATALPSILTVFEKPLGDSSDFAILGSGDGTNGAGGPGILQTLGRVAFATLWLPVVTGVFGGWIATLATMTSLFQLYDGE